MVWPHGTYVTLNVDALGMCASLTSVSDRIVSTTAGVLVGRKEELFCLETALSLERTSDSDWRMPVRHMGFAF